MVLEIQRACSKPDRFSPLERIEASGGDSAVTKESTTKKQGVRLHRKQHSTAAAAAACPLSALFIIAVFSVWQTSQLREIEIERRFRTVYISYTTFSLLRPN